MGKKQLSRTVIIDFTIPKVIKINLDYNMLPLLLLLLSFSYPMKTVVLKSFFSFFPFL